MTFSALGISIETRGADDAARRLDAVSVAAEKVDAAVEKISPSVDRASLGLGKLGREAKTADGALANLANRTLTGFNAIAHRAAMEAEHVARQIERMNMHDLRANDVAAYGQELDRLRARYNPLYREINQYRTALGDIRQAHAVGAISATEMAAAITRERQASLASIAALKGRTQAVREAATAVRGFHTTNLLFQMQDIGMMAAMGQAPHILALQQGTQVAGIFHQIGNGKQVVEALKGAVLGLINPLSLATVGVIGLGAAAVQYMSKSEESIDKLDGILERHKAIIGSIREAYGDAAIAAADYAKASGDELRVRLKASVEEMRVQFRATMNELISGGEVGQMSVGLNAAGVNAGFFRANSEFALFQEQIGRLRDRQPDLEAIRKEISAIGLANGAEVQADKLLTLLNVVTDLDARIREGAQGFDRYNAALRRLASEGLRDANETLRSFAPDRRTDLEKVEAAYLKAIGAATRLGVTARAAEGIIIAAERDRAAAVEELARKEEARRSQYELDLRAIGARSAAEKAAIAAERERLNLSGETLSEAEKAMRIEEARTLSLRQSQYEASEALRKRIEAEQETIAQMEMDIALIGKGVAETARLSTEYDLLLAAKRAAFDEGRSLGEDEIERIRRHAAEVGRVAEEYAKVRALNDLSFERSLFGMSDGDQRIMSALRQMGIDANSAYGQMVGGAMRYNQVLAETQAELKQVQDLGKDAFMSILDIMYETGDIGEKLIGIFAGIGKQFAKMGMERLWKSISGQGSSIFDGISGTGTGSFSPVQVGREIGQSIAPSISTSLNENLASFAAAIRKVESGSYAGNYGAKGPMVTSGMYAGDHAYGAYQVMGKNIASWTKEALGHSLTIQQFVADRAAQDKVFFHKFGQSLDKFGTFADATSVWFSGRPLGQAGSSSDGYHTVPQYVQKANDALAGYPGGLKTGVSDGVVDANRRLQMQGYREEMSGNGSLGFLQDNKLGNLFGVGSAALGAFAGGYQSGSPFGGAVSGAMAGFGAAPALSALGAGAAAGPLGIIGGAIIGLIGGIFGKSKQKKEELKQAQQEIEQQMGAITQMIAAATGNFMGQFETSLVETHDEFSKAIALANKAGNRKLVRELKDAQREFFDTMADTWERGFEGMLSSLNAGLGLDGDFLSGMDAVEKMRESLVGFVNDAKMFEEANGNLAAYVKGKLGGSNQQNALSGPFSGNGLFGYQKEYQTGFGDSIQMIANEFVAGYVDLGKQLVEMGVAAFDQNGGQLYDTLEELRRAAFEAGLAIDEQGRVTKDAAAANGDLADSVRRAQEAAVASALALISGAKEFTEMEKAVQRAEGAVASLPSLLEDLGVSAEEAARAIDAHLAIAMAKLRDGYRDEVNASINDLSGFGFLNEIIDAHKRYEARLKDAAALGMDASLATRELNLALEGIAQSAGLTQGEIDMLAAAFPMMAGLIEAVAGKDVIAQVTEAESVLRAAYERQKAEIDSAVSRLGRLTESIKRFREEMRVSASSPLSQREQMEEALRLFRDTAAAAMSGDEAAQEKLTSVGQSALDEARAYYASSEDYANIWREIDATMGLVESHVGRQLSEAQQQLQALRDLVSPLIDINESVLSVREAIAALADATSARDRMLQEQISAARESGAETRNAEIAAMYQTILGRTGSASEIGWWANTDKSIDTIRADIEWAKMHGAMRYGGIVGSYQSGGVVGNGLFDVDSVLARYAGGGMIGLAGGEFVMPAPQTRAFMPDLRAMQAGTYKAGNDNGALVAEIRALREEVQGLRAATSEGANRQTILLKENNEIAARNASTLGRVASRM